MATLHLEADEAARVAAARAGVARLGLTVTEVARRIGRARQSVSGVLHGREWQPQTLALVEALLEEVADERAAEVAA